MPSLKLLVLVVEPENRREANPRYRFKTQNQKDAEGLNSAKPLIIILDNEKIIIEVPMRKIKRWGRIYCDEINTWIRENSLHTYNGGNPPKLIFTQTKNILKLLFVYFEKNQKINQLATKNQPGCDGYFIYENWTHKYLRIHEGKCGHCNCGNGVQENILGAVNGKWHNKSYSSYQIAKKIADEIAIEKEFDVMDCGRCKPQNI